MRESGLWGDFVSDSPPSVRDVGRVDEIAEKAEDENNAEELFDTEGDVVEDTDEDRVKEISHDEPTNAKTHDAGKANSAIEVEKLAGIVPPFEVFESLKIPGGKILHETAADEGSKKDDDGLFLEVLEKNSDAETAEAVNWQPWSVQDTAIDEFSGINEKKPDFPDPADKSANEKD